MPINSAPRNQHPHGNSIMEATCFQLLGPSSTCYQRPSHREGEHDTTHHGAMVVVALSTVSQPFWTLANCATTNHFWVSATVCHSHLWNSPGRVSKISSWFGFRLQPMNKETPKSPKSPSPHKVAFWGIGTTSLTLSRYIATADHIIISPLVVLVHIHEALSRWAFPHHQLVQPNGSLITSTKHATASKSFVLGGATWEHCRAPRDQGLLFLKDFVWKHVGVSINSKSDTVTSNHPRINRFLNIYTYYTLLLKGSKIQTGQRYDAAHACRGVHIECLSQHW